jgi:hypothetical protein
MPNHHGYGGTVRRLAATGSLLAVCVLGSAGSRAGAEHALLAGYGTSGAAPSPGAAHAASGVAGPSQTGSFSIAGNVVGLYPGSHLPLVLTISNPQTFAITVTSISTVVSRAAIGCGAANVKVTAFSGQLVVKAGKHAKTTVHADMIHSAPNTCQGASFPFRYSGIATAGST